MDFEEDQLAIEAYVRMRCGWRDESEISEEEYLAYAIEYIQENPFADEAVSLPRESLTYDRTANGADRFVGEHIHFGTEKYPDWDSVLGYLG